MDFQQAIHWS